MSEENGYERLSQSTYIVRKQYTNKDPRRKTKELYGKRGSVVSTTEKIYY